MSAANVSKAWIGLEAEALFEKELGRGIHFVNDADAAGYAEARFGAAKDVRGVVLLTTLGTGIGSALINDGVLVPNTELGHLELGGNDAAIILDDADVETTVARLLPVAFFNSGQACALPKRIFAPSGRYEEFVEAFGAAASAMTVGDPTDAATQLGPLTTRFQLERIDELVTAAIAAGARSTALV